LPVALWNRAAYVIVIGSAQWRGLLLKKQRTAVIHSRSAMSRPLYSMKILRNQCALAACAKMGVDWLFIC
jgi:hypothetical protein